MRNADPVHTDRKQGEHEEKQKIYPQDPPVDFLRNLKQMVVIDPIDPHQRKAEQITEKSRQQFLDRRRFSRDRRGNFKHHNGDDDGDHAVAERLDSTLRHSLSFQFSKEFISLRFESREVFLGKGCLACHKRLTAESDSRSFAADNLHLHHFEQLGE